MSESLATQMAAICVRFQWRRVRHMYVTMQITFLTRKSAIDSEAKDVTMDISPHSGSRDRSDPDVAIKAYMTLAWPLRDSLD